MTIDCATAIECHAAGEELADLKSDCREVRKERDQLRLDASRVEGERDALARMIELDAASRVQLERDLAEAERRPRWRRVIAFVVGALALGYVGGRVHQATRD